MIPLLTLGFLAVMALGASPAEASKKRPTPQDIRLSTNPKISLAYARKWASVFHVPISYILTLAHIESSHNPSLIGRAVTRKDGKIAYAMGLIQQMSDEVEDKVQRIRQKYGHNPIVKKTLAKWKGDPRILLDPDFNTMLAAWQVGTANQRFGRFDLVAAAYHQGEPKIMQRIARGEAPIDPELQPKGAAYVSRALTIEPLYEGVA